MARWLIARRALQLGLLAAFAGAPWGGGAPLVQGTLASSLWFGQLPLADPLVLLQSALAGQRPTAAGWIGAGLVLAVAAVLAGRLYCAWVCPVNLVTDAAEALRRALGWRGALLPRADRRLRLVVLALVLAASAAAGTLAWESLNPITHAVRAVAFGLWGAGAAALGAVLACDLLLLRRGWCGHLCPVGAFYALVGRWGRLHVRAARAAACTHCGDCFVTCPEPQVIAPVLRAGAVTLAITDADCLRCGRCIERCGEQVFEFGLGSATGGKNLRPRRPS